MELLQSRIPETPEHPWFLGAGGKQHALLFSESVYLQMGTEPGTSPFPFRSLSALFLVYLMAQALLEASLLITHACSGYNHFLALLCVSCVFTSLF